MRIELVNCVVCALLGAGFLAGTHTMREMSLVLFGWAFGCVFHLTLTVIVDLIARRRSVGRR